MAAGHEVTLFHRGTKGTGAIPGAEDLLGDRKTDLDKLSDRKWDAVMDSCGYFPADVRAAAEALKDRCHRYLFVSTVSVYSSDQPVDDEGSPLVEIGDPNATEVTGQSYGYLKVLCEQALEEVFGDRATIVRPGIIAGPYDPTDRFTYWPVRFARGGRVLVPDVLKSALQIIDARDLGQFMVHLLESDQAGIFNTAGPRSTFGHMIDMCRTFDPEADVFVADPTHLQEANVQLWSDLPLSMGHGDDGLMHTNSRKAADAGLRYRPLSETAKDTLEWRFPDLESRPLKTGLTIEREGEVLAGLTS